MILVVVLLGFLGSVLVAYRTEEEARRRDQVRAVLQSYADDFLCKNVRDSTGAIQGFFKVSAVPTGDGLEWINGDWVVSTGGSGLRLRLGGETQAPEVVVTRMVREVQATATLGTPVDALPVYASVGRELVGEFTGTYMVGRSPRSLTLRVVRLDVFS